MTATDGLDLNQVTAFVRVIESGSFTAAARELGLPKSSVSRRVSALETALRVRLLQRSTRQLVLTEAGRLYFERARAALRGLAEANVAVTDLSHEIAGPIRFTAGGDNTGLIANLLAEFLTRYPKIQIDVVLTPRRVDLVAEGFDLALRAGPLGSPGASGGPSWGCSLRRPTSARRADPRPSPIWPSTASCSSAHRTSESSFASPAPMARRA
jgi:DNA-binding transcriptional LysR family regulator